ncbi:MAG: hypothetical protein MRERV_96c002 [Mycoplasmataceae bacterium RV_VA103A]|nr:MAG: hypothetical protein MRERV_96c002 [Mycoplasmataceae bacterium RV_VA103A]
MIKIKYFEKDQVQQNKWRAAKKNVRILSKISPRKKMHEQKIRLVVNEEINMKNNSFFCLIS